VGLLFFNDDQKVSNNGVSMVLPGVIVVSYLVLNEVAVDNPRAEL
jgi:hypothetical protein